MKIYSHDDCLRHSVPMDHPECSARLSVVLEHLRQTGFTDDHPVLSAPAIPRECVLQAHSPDYLQHLEAQDAAQGLVALDADTWLGLHSLAASKYAAGAVWQGVQDVVAGDDRRVFCAVRPPGHHAEKDTAMGFCLLNSVAIAAINALSLPGIDRVAVLDFDVHHGNGTVEMCRDYPEILVCSSFQHPYYPHRQHDVVQPNIVNTPLPAGSCGADFLRAIDADWWPAITRHRPDIILISAGFDAHRDDPLAQCQWLDADFRCITEQIVAAAKQFARGRVVSVLEGGYNLEVLPGSVMAHLEALAAS